MCFGCQQCSIYKPAPDLSTAESVAHYIDKDKSWGCFGNGDFITPKMHLNPLPPTSLFSCLHSFLLTALVGFHFPQNGLNTHFALLCSLPTGLAPLRPHATTPGALPHRSGPPRPSRSCRVRHPRHHPCSDATPGLQTPLVPSASPRPASPKGLPDGHALSVFRYPPHGNSRFR